MPCKEIWNWYTTDGSVWQTEAVSETQMYKAKIEAQMYDANSAAKIIEAETDAQIAEAEDEDRMSKAKTEDQMNKAETEAWLPGSKLDLFDWPKLNPKWMMQRLNIKCGKGWIQMIEAETESQMNDANADVQIAEA